MNSSSTSSLPLPALRVLRLESPFGPTKASSKSTALTMAHIRFGGRVVATCAESSCEDFMFLNALVSYQRKERPDVALETHYLFEVDVPKRQLILSMSLQLPPPTVAGAGGANVRIFFLRPNATDADCEGVFTEISKLIPLTSAAPLPSAPPQQLVDSSSSSSSSEVRFIVSHFSSREAFRSASQHLKPASLAGRVVVLVIPLQQESLDLRTAMLESLGVVQSCTQAGLRSSGVDACALSAVALERAPSNSLHVLLRTSATEMTVTLQHAPPSSQQRQPPQHGEKMAHVPPGTSHERIVVTWNNFVTPLIQQSAEAAIASSTAAMPPLPPPPVADCSKMARLDVTVADVDVPGAQRKETQRMSSFLLRSRGGLVVLCARLHEISTAPSQMLSSLLTLREHTKELSGTLNCVLEPFGDSKYVAVFVTTRPLLPRPFLLPAEMPVAEFRVFWRDAMRVMKDGMMLAGGAEQEEEGRATMSTSEKISALRERVGRQSSSAESSDQQQRRRQRDGVSHEQQQQQQQPKLELPKFVPVQVEQQPQQEWWDAEEPPWCLSFAPPIRFDLLQHPPCPFPETGGADCLWRPPPILDLGTLRSVSNSSNINDNVVSLFSQPPPIRFDMTLNPPRPFL